MASKKSQIVDLLVWGIVSLGVIWLLRLTFSAFSEKGISLLDQVGAVFATVALLIAALYVSSGRSTNWRNIIIWGSAKSKKNWVGALLLVFGLLTSIVQLIAPSVFQEIGRVFREAKKAADNTEVIVAQTKPALSTIYRNIRDDWGMAGCATIYRIRVDANLMTIRTIRHPPGTDRYDAEAQITSGRIVSVNENDDIMTTVDVTKGRTADSGAGVGATWTFSLQGKQKWLSWHPASMPTARLMQPC